LLVELQYGGASEKTTTPPGHSSWSGVPRAKIPRNVRDSQVLWLREFQPNLRVTNHRVQPNGPYTLTLSKNTNSTQPNRHGGLKSIRCPTSSHEKPRFNASFEK